MKKLILIIAVIMLLLSACKEDENKYEDLLLDKIWNITEPLSDSIPVMRDYSDQLLFSIERYGKSRNCYYKKQGVRWKWIDDNSIQIYKLLVDSPNYEIIEEIKINYIDETLLIIDFLNDKGKLLEAKYKYSETPK